MTILVTGANGNVSSAVIRSGLAAGLDLAALVRKPVTIPGVQTIVGDLEEPDSLDFSGIDTLWLLNAMGPQAPHASSNAVWAARRAGVKHVVRLSAIGAAHDAPTRNGRLHALSDVEALASGIPTTIVRPAFFMQNLLGAISGDTLFHAVGSARIGMIDVRDIADFAVAVMSAPPQAHAGKVYTITGPQSLSMAEAATVLGVGVHEISRQDAVDAMLGAGFPRWVAEVSGHEYGAAYASGWGDYTTPDFTAVTGRPARTLAELAREQVPAGAA
ncbi:NAD(P)H-binding protein [Allorhizocola rhizosphaerae]|uniref:NAD(P)H-binding protein n=1 Tax=Allorhizocola rhizosphaerae TaxID=1872709 RepID=UPI000E3B6B7D|nr:NAD(P)H-binding protein [Allorhizocola rhizosphaerae]